jgi:hypothetical protein
MGKETYRNGKRDLPQWQKRPTAMAKETYRNGKRDLLPTTTIAKEKRDLLAQ